MLNKLNFELFASVYSSSMPPEVKIREDGTVSLFVNHFYYYKGEQDIILFSGDSSPLSDHYEFSDLILSYAQKFKVKELYSIGARWAEPLISPFEYPKVLGFATDEYGLKKLEENGVILVKNEPAHYFSNLIVGLAPFYGIRGYKLSVNHGEPKPHPKSLIVLLKALERLIKLKVDLSELEEYAKYFNMEIEDILSSLKDSSNPPKKDIYI
ncbi:hypothetical protein HRbin06_01069 [archaeon HR06]|nr:hypothetical protein HRbin06_01069 [archaeon HR06]